MQTIKYNDAANDIFSDRNCSAHIERLIKFLRAHKRHYDRPDIFHDNSCVVGYFSGR